MRILNVSSLLVLLSALLLPPRLAAAAEEGVTAGHAADPHGGALVHAVPHLDGSDLGLLWVAPFVGILLSIALFPLFLPHVWHHHFGKLSAFWAAAFLVPALFAFGFEVTLYSLLHTYLLEYIPFIILLFALFTVAGGICVRGRLAGSPGVNTGMLGIGTLLASWMGTTGAAMLLIRPLIRANRSRRHRAHIMVFFIFLVANVGGSLTPLGDPPLFLGFLKGVDFFWTTVHMFVPMLVVAVPLLVIFYVLDSFYLRREPGHPEHGPAKERFGIEGKVNFLLLAGIVGAVLLSGLWKPGVSFSIYHVEVALEQLARDVLLILIALVSIQVTRTETRAANDFTWFPIQEVAMLFAGIFVTIIPAIAILQAGTDGALGAIVAATRGENGEMREEVFFWATGALSAFLDNAPTYLVFFNAAGGDPAQLMGPLETTLLAISAGAVFMGAMSYIGNAPNFMVKSIAEENNIAMPSFFGYMIWSCLFLLPLFVVVTFLFFV
jgi:Na+/H+ antiporter NhaD/arsenite permease-like protein